MGTLPGTVTVAVVKTIAGRITGKTAAKIANRGKTVNNGRTAANKAVARTAVAAGQLPISLRLRMMVTSTFALTVRQQPISPDLLPFAD